MTRPRILGAVLAGGRSSRFGSDKAVALLHGVPLVEHVITAVRPQVDEVAICGRTYGDFVSLPDRPAAGLGPLGGLCSALHHAAQSGFGAVLSVSCDTPVLPADLVECLSRDAPAFVMDHQIVGLWPAVLAKRLDAHLRYEQDRSMRLWSVVTHAHAVKLSAPIENINLVSELRAIQEQEKTT